MTLVSQIAELQSYADVLNDAAAAAEALVSARSGIQSLSFSGGSTPDMASTGSAVSDKDSARAELRIIEIDEAEAKLKADLDQHNELVAAEEAVAAKIGDHVTDLQNTLTESNDQLAKMRQAAGLDDTSGVGGEKKKLTDALNEARARLQYLEDTGAAEDAIAAQKKATDDLTAKLADAERRFRVADYDLTHSDAWQKQLQQIADQQAVIKAEQEKQAVEEKRLEAMRTDLAAREATIQKLEDDKAAQQKILDKQRQDVEAAAAVQRKAALQKELGDVAAATSVHVGIIRLAAATATQQVQDAVNQGGTQLEATAAQVSQTIVDTASSAVETAGAAIKSKLSAAMQSLLDLVGGGPQDAQGFGDSTTDKEYGSQFAGQFRDEQGNVSGGAISDATYAMYVQNFIASKKRYEDDNAPGMQKYQAIETIFQMKLEQIWQQLGGFQRFNETLEQIYREQKTQGTAIAGVSRAVGTPRPAPPPPRTGLSGGRVMLHIPTVATRPDPSKTQLQVLIRTGQL